MEYTKGEWRYIIIGLESKVVDDKVGIIAHLEERIKLAEIEANAHLIAAAPALYEACKAIVAEGTRCLDAARPGREIYDIDKVDRMARQAIAKAEKGG